MPISQQPQYFEALGTLLKGSSFSTLVNGQCMAPAVPDGTRVTVDPGSRLRCGDIMLWRDTGGRLVCHRYLGRFPGRRGVGAVSWADNASCPDALVPSACVIGKVSAVGGRMPRNGVGQRWRSRIRYWRFSALAVRRLFG